ncbi:hypothetical protein FB45DRAFT_1059793 [Roridomyces roridus]|uniref:DUF6534 domain-containing protein n=1 Tax=Roridomyces roridus TaxID=1738132 RepID=A0AAD7FJ59_9AGAR|nr:hypothetical protein FB45DRAFT_1059793 [Roridomyces roridus]
MPTISAPPPEVQTAVIQMPVSFISCSSVPMLMCNRAGTMILVYLADIGLCGILSVQIYTYSLAFPNDRWMTKIFVYSIYVLELLMTCLFIHDAFTMYGPGFGDITGATRIRTGWYMSCIVNGIGEHLLLILCGSAHTLNSWVIPAMIAILALCANIGALATGIFVIHLTDIAAIHRSPFVSVTTVIWGGGSALTDIIIAVLMIYYLLRRSTQFHQAHAIISRLIRMIIETGTMTALVALLSEVLYFAFPNRPYYAAGSVILAKSYSIAALVILNSRAKIVSNSGTEKFSTGLLFAHPGSTTS